MLNHQDNERICRVGREQPMGKFLRRNWLPFLLPEPLVAGGDPQAVQLLGEDFVVWRDAHGRPALFADGCLHRGASMLLARAEPDGLRCIYHGWKFGIDGKVLETPNVSDPDFKDRLRGRTFPVREAGGLFWTYLGAPGTEPEFPHWHWMDLPESNRLVVEHVQECNFVQVIEGLIDSTHLGFLHADAVRKTSDSSLEYANKISSVQFNLAPRLEAQDTEYGFFYAALRDRVDGQGALQTEARVTGFVAPFTVLNANGDIASHIVPLSDTRTAFIHIYWSETQKINEEPLRTEQLKFVGLDPECLASFGLTRSTLGKGEYPQRSNRFHQNRQSMRNGESWSGMPGLTEEDTVVTVSPGPIRDRSVEMLCSSDLAIAKLYRTLLRSVDEQQPPVVDWPRVRAANKVLAAGEDWRGMVPALAPSAAETAR
ncbi:Rieske 2Fe-2S domain-containing protein [Variovorax sp. RA8]|uniref:Rieske 2Fe-2S domain-containing protein n=1 Tax=Variovorax sp. (strain JCM 16519 / RA8) TaxID=662548 RepID=UPI001316B1FB|nr:Rieske 2Fe-2S domain-containing protein [Variovorax sp. RA8]VTU41580.1 Phthalate 4,5-dioxygenase oxygenase subunit [Variovorax sp. RA8]